MHIEASLLDPSIKTLIHQIKLEELGWIATNNISKLHEYYCNLIGNGV